MVFTEMHCQSHAVTFRGQQDLEVQPDLRKYGNTIVSYMLYFPFIIIIIMLLQLIINLIVLLVICDFLL